MSGILSQFRLHHAVQPRSPAQGLTSSSQSDSESSFSLSRTSSAITHASVLSRDQSPALPAQSALIATTRREREREEEDSLSGTNDVRAHKRLKTYGAELARELSIPNDALNEFIEVRLHRNVLFLLASLTI